MTTEQTTAPIHLLKNGVPAHRLTTEDASKGGQTRWAKERERRELVEREVKEQAVEELKDALLKSIRVLVGQLESEDERIAQAAAKDILDRNMGKPTSHIETEDVTESRPLRDLSDADLRRVAGGAFDRLRASKGS